MPHEYPNLWHTFFPKYVAFTETHMPHTSRRGIHTFYNNIIFVTLWDTCFYNL